MFRIINFFFFIGFIFMIFGCEDDQICIEQLTTKFKSEIKPLATTSPFSVDTIKVADITDLNSLKVFAGDNKSQFEVLLPQNLTNVTYKIELIFSSTDSTQTKPPLTETLNINYNSKNSFVSKACGFRTLFSNLSYSTGGQLIINNFKTEINNSNETHLNLQF